MKTCLFTSRSLSPGNADDALHEMLLGIHRVVKYNDVAALRMFGTAPDNYPDCVSP